MIWGSARMASCRETRGSPPARMARGVAFEDDASVPRQTGEVEPPARPQERRPRQQASCPGCGSRASSAAFTSNTRTHICGSGQTAAGGSRHKPTVIPIWRPLLPDTFFLLVSRLSLNSFQEGGIKPSAACQRRLQGAQ